MKQRFLKVIVVIAFGLCGFLVHSSQGYAAEIPYGAGGYCWGVSADEMPDLAFVMHAGTSAISVYQVGNLNSYNLGDYLPNNIKPKEIRILCSTNRGYFEIQMNHIDLRYFRTIYSYLVKAYGVSISKESRTRNGEYMTENWENDNTSINLCVFTKNDGGQDFGIIVSHKG